MVMTQGEATAAQSGTGPLHRFRVLELGSTAAGPFATRLMADFGAEVVKIEFRRGDPVRFLGGTFKGKSLYAATIFRNKYNVSLDLHTEAGRDVLRRMVPHFDVVIENFRPGTLEKWGLGYDVLSALNPRLVLTRISGYGQTGPYRERPGYGVIGEAMSGLRNMIGDDDRPPSRVGVPLTDYITALYAVYGTMMALMARDESGTGQVVDAALVEAAFSFMEAYVPAYEKLGVEGRRSGAKLPNSAPNNLYRTADGQYIHIAALADGLFRRLCEVMGVPDVAADVRYATQAARNVHEAGVEAVVSRWVATLPLAEAEALLVREGIPASRVYTMGDIFRDPHYAARHMLVPVPDEDWGQVTLAGVTPRLSRTPGGVAWAGHRVGEDTRLVLQRYAGLGAEEIDALIADGVAYCDADGVRACD